jgi:membrane associated rhomboid family serine protease
MSLSRVPAFLIQEFRERPATMGVCTVWVAVYLVMGWQQGTFQPDASHPFVRGMRNETCHIFGSMTAVEIRHGQWWRALTATGIHVGLLHLGINLLGFYRLGDMLEEWYGSAQILLLYVVIGLGGNLLAAAIKLSLGFQTAQPSVGGSVVLCGFMSLIGVVAWRSRTRFGRFILSQVLWSFLSVAGLGLMTSIVDNLGHLGGAVVGILVGFAHRPLVRNAHRTLAKVLGVVSAGLIVATIVTQERSAHAEAVAIARAKAEFPRREKDRMEHVLRLREDIKAAGISRQLLADVVGLYVRLARGDLLASTVRPLPTSRKTADLAFRFELARKLRLLRQRPNPWASSRAPEPYARVLEAGRRALAHRPTPSERHAFENDAGRTLLEADRWIREAERAWQRLSTAPSSQNTAMPTSKR